MFLIIPEITQKLHKCFHILLALSTLFCLIEILNVHLKNCYVVICFCVKSSKPTSCCFRETRTEISLILIALKMMASSHHLQLLQSHQESKFMSTIILPGLFSKAYKKLFNILESITNAWLFSTK